MTDIEMLPCPFCGVSGAEVGGLVPWVQCEACDASGPQRESEADAISAWNTRAKDAEIEALRAEVATWEGLHASEVQVRQRWQARAERLAEAIKAYKSECDNPAKDYVLRAKRRDEMFALLHGHDQEGGNP